MQKNNKKRVEKLIEIALVIVVLLFFFKILLFPLLSKSIVYFFGTEETGTVIEQLDVPCKINTLASKSECYIPVVMYESESGREFVFDKGNINSSKELYSNGKSVTIFVNPLDKSKGLVNEYGEVWDELLLHMLFTVFFIVVYLWIYLKLKKKYKNVPIIMIIARMFRKSGGGIL